jgi:hypothetical protein
VSATARSWPGDYLVRSCCWSWAGSISTSCSTE